ncbi:MAG: winged helix-turn-helix transcriptional regulator [Endomicrobium sp.]|jgi:predicted HTH transcriptional regulator|nr:winged helix-turn-helix transcriptional regulator [Endomicrobium sp.]
MLQVSQKRLKPLGINDTAKSKSDTVNDTTSDKILTLIKKEPNIPAAMLASKSGFGIATVKRHIKKLKESGVISRIGSDKTGHWKIIESKGSIK